MAKPPAKARAFERIERFLDARGTKILLGVLVIVSVLPAPELEAHLRTPLAVLFGVELLARLMLTFGRPERPTRRDVLFLCVDALAFASFLPLEVLVSPVDIAVLRLLRVFRLLALLRYAEDLTADVYRAITQREQLAQFWLVSVAVVGTSFAAAVVLTQLAVPHEGAAHEGTAGFVDRMWWAFRQLESPDNLVQSLEVHPVLAVMSLLLTIFGVFLISYLIGIGANIVDEVVQAERRRPVPFGGHTVVVGPTHECEPLVRELVRLYAKNRRLLREWPKGAYRWLTQSRPMAGRPVVPRVALLGESETPPAYLYESSMRRVSYRQGDGADPAALERVGAPCARRALVLREPRAGADADALGLARLSAFRALNPSAHVFVEVVRSDHGEVVRAIGGEGTYVLDVPRFLGLFLCQHLVVPGMAPLLRELLSADGCEVYTHVFSEPGEQEALRAMAAGEGAAIPFEALATFAHETHDVTLVGVLLGTEPVPEHPLGLVGADGLTLWLNPTDEPPESCRWLGAERGRVPLASVRGFVGIADNYFPIREFARDFLGLSAGVGLPASTPAEARSAEGLIDALGAAPEPLDRVLVIGYSHALPWLLRGLDRFVPGVDVRVVLAVSSGEDRKLERWLDSLRYGLDAPDLAPERPLPLPGGGRVTVSRYEGPDRTGFADDVLGEHGADAVVFLSDGDAEDPDARVALQALKLVRAACRSGHLSEARKLHLLVEIGAAHRGDALKRDLARIAGGTPGLTVTRVSTEEIKSYFMVQGALVPGVLELYQELLGAPGREVVRLPLAEAAAASSPFRALRAALAELGCVPIALERADGSVQTSPPPDLVVRPGDVRAIFVVGDASALAARLRDRKEPPVEPVATDAA